MKRVLLLAGLLALALSACVPAANRAPEAQRYVASFDVAYDAVLAAMDTLEANGYGPYRIMSQDRNGGTVSASWTSGAGVTYTVTATVRSLDSSTSEVAIVGSTTSAEQSTYATVLYLYGELDGRLSRLEPPA